MDCQISPRDWDDLLGQPPEVKLTFLWAKTNAETAASLIGAFQFRAKKFAMDTGLEEQWFADTCTALPHCFALEAGWVWLVQHIATHYGRGPAMPRGNTVKGTTFAKNFALLPPALQARVLETYPELMVLPLASPSQALASPSQALASVKNTPGGEGEGGGSEMARAWQALGKPLPESGAERVAQNFPPTPEAKNGAAGQALAKGSCTAQHSSTPSGESEGDLRSAGGALIPDEAEVLQFARSWAGDMAMGIPAGIPAGYAMSWLNWRTGETAPPFPRDWRADLVKRFRADWVKGRADTRHPARPGEKNAPALTHAEIVTALATENDPARRQALLDQLKAAS